MDPTANPNEPSKVNGQYNSMVGSAKELVGNTIEAGYAAVGGSTEQSSWTASGQKQHAAGEAEIKAAQAQGYVEGAADKVGGKVNNVIGAVTGDKEQQLKGAAREDKGHAQMEINKPSS